LRRRCLYFIDLLKDESSDDFTIAQYVTPIIQELSTNSIRVNWTVIDNVCNLVRALDPDELTEAVQILSWEKAFHMRCGCLSGHLALEDLGRQSDTFSRFKIK
jgi:hypothetical protein